MNANKQIIIVFDLDGVIFKKLSRLGIAGNAIADYSCSGIPLIYRYIGKKLRTPDIPKFSKLIAKSMKNLEFSSDIADELAYMYMQKSPNIQVKYCSNLGRTKKIREMVMAQLSPIGVKAEDVILLPPGSSKLNYFKQLRAENPDAVILFGDDSPAHILSGQQADFDYSILIGSKECPDAVAFIAFCATLFSTQFQR